MIRVLVSACLLGEKVRYNGADAASGSQILQDWMREGRVVPFCPEVAGGLGVPRPAAEIQGQGGGSVLDGAGQVRTRGDEDVTAAFLRGAELALQTAVDHGARLAILKDGSPSCGSGFIYDGSFSGRREPAVGVATALLERNAIKVFSESRLDEAAAYLRRLEGGTRSMRCALAMDELQIEALNRMVGAVNAGDAHGYSMVYAPEALITISGGDALKGRAAIEAYEVVLLREYPGARLGFGSVWQKGLSVVVRYAVSGSVPGGKTMGHEGLLFYRFLPSGKIAEERRYLDSLTPMAQLGALGTVPARALPAVPDKPEAHVAADVASRRETENVARVRATIAALDAKDEAGFLSGLADDVVLDEMIELQPVAGMAAARAWFQSRTAAVADGKTEITTALGVGDVVLVEAVARGTLSGRLGRVSAAGKPFTVHQAAIVQLREGTISRITTFMNGKELAQAVGQWPPAVVK